MRVNRRKKESVDRLKGGGAGEREMREDEEYRESGINMCEKER